MKDIKWTLVWCFLIFLIKTSGGAIKKKIMSNKELAKELCKRIIRTLIERKVFSTFIVNI